MTGRLTPTMSARFLFAAAAIAILIAPTVAAGNAVSPQQPATVATIVAVFQAPDQGALYGRCADVPFMVDAAAHPKWSIPRTVDGKPVKISRIISILEGDNEPVGSPCVRMLGACAPSSTCPITRGKEPALDYFAQRTVTNVVHRGFYGTWTTSATLPALDYTLVVASPIGYRLTMVADLVAA